MTQPMITLGFAHYEDFRAAALTIQSIRFAHPNVMPVAEFVIIDTTPLQVNGAKSPHSTALEGLAAGVNTSVPCRYFHRPDLTGTSYSRREIFRQAAGDVVMVFDCHTTHAIGSLDAIITHFQNPDNARDILHGPILTDGLGLMGDHFDPYWGSDLMLGRWNVTWIAPDGKWYVCREGGENNQQVEFFTASLPREKIDMGMNLAWAGHEAILQENGHKLAVSQPNPFHIPAMGLGMFAMKREHLPEFPEGLKGFGGEECSLHDAVVQNGGKVICHPAAAWWHLTGYPERGGGSPYTQDLIDNRLNNYLRWMKRNGVDPTYCINLFRARFDTDELQRRIDALVADVFPPAPVNLPVLSELDQWYERAKNTPSDINEHAESLYSLAAYEDHVVEFGVRHGVSTVALLAAQPKRLTVYDVQRQPEVAELERLKGDCDFRFNLASSILVEIEPCDVLFIDTQHTAKQLHAELTLHQAKVGRFIAMHDTEVFGDHGDDGGKGLKVAISSFLAKHPNWRVYSHAANNNGFTVLANTANVLNIPESVPLVLPPPEEIPLPTPGPGDELKAMLHEIGIQSTTACQCQTKMNQMNAWGADGCRQHFNEIVGFIRDGAKSFGWEEPLRIKAEGEKAGLLTKIGWAIGAVRSGVASKVNWTDPFPGLVTEAIRRSEQKAKVAS